MYIQVKILHATLITFNSKLSITKTTNGSLRHNIHIGDKKDTEICTLKYSKQRDPERNVAFYQRDACKSGAKTYFCIDSLESAQIP